MSNVLHTARNIKPIKVALASGGTPSPERQAFNAAFALARAKYLAGQGPSTFPYKGALYGVDVANKPMLQGRVGQPANVPLQQNNLGQSFSAPTEDHAAPMQQPNNWGASGFGGDKDVSPAPNANARPQGTVAPMASGSLLQRAQAHYQYLTSIGATPNEATMLTSAAAAESGFNPNIWHDNNNGYGMYGHNLNRLDMRGMSAQEQAAAALDELRNRPEGKLVNSTNDPTQLTIAQMRYERPKGWTPQAPQNGSQWGNRLAYTKQFSGFGQQDASASNPALTATNTGPAPFYGDLPPSPANVPLPPVRPASFDQSPPLASGLPSAPAPGTRGLSFAPAEDDQALANNWAQMHTQVGANVPAEDYEAPSFGEGITPSSYEVKPNADEAAMKAMEDDLAAHKQGMGADSLWEANKDSYADGGEVDQEPINAYHGSPHYIGEEGFQDKAIGTGEGAQDYGHGHYLAEAEPTANEYKGENGHMYQVAIHAHPDHFLDWDKDVSEQHPHILNAITNLIPKDEERRGGLREFSENPDDYAGGAIIHYLHEAYGPKKTSDMLHGVGIKGIKYLDAVSRVAGKGTHNYVVFDPKDIEIMRRYAQGGDVSAWHPNHPLFGKAQGGEVNRNVNSLGLYSEGADIASQAKQPEQTPQQWQQYLSTRVKPDEMRWSGVGDMLASGSGKLHKDDVAEAFDHSNMNDYQENVYRGMNAPHARYQLAGPKENYREVVLQHKPEEEKFAARGHYSDSNPLLHIRMSDRPHPEGGKILHVEELQSDWGQKGRQKGFKDQSLQKEYEDAFEKWEKASDTYWPIYEKETEQFYHLHWNDPLRSNLIKPYFEKYNLAMEPFINAKIAAEEKLKTQKNKISPAPHVEDTNKWVDLGLKRILAEAAKGDYRGISFTSGGSQAARWNNEEGLIKPYDETIPSRMQKLMNQHDSSNQFQKYAIPFTEEDKFFSHYIPMSDEAADSIQKGQKRFKRGGYIPHHNPIVEQALNKTSIAPLDVMSLVKRSRGRP